MTEQRDKNFVRGIIALAVGILIAVIGALWAHFAGLPRLDDFGRELYPHIPRGYDEWPSKLLGQLVSLGGVLLAMAGIALAFLYEKRLTWARAAIGAGLFTGLMIILFGIVPNEWLTYTQAEWEWTSQKLWIQIPTSLLGGNELNISAAAIKDIIAAGYVTVMTGAIAAAMIAWQKRDEILANRDKKKAAAADSKVSVYGRPLQKVER
jgi:K+ transporter